MKTVWVLLLQLYTILHGVSCNENILSKFHQNGFKIKDFRMELMNYSEKYFNFVKLNTFKYNRTTADVNITFNFKIAVKDKTEVVVQVQKFLSNEYRHFPIRFQVNMKKAYDANAVGLQRTKDCGNTTSFYFEKDITYHVCNYVPDESCFPPLIPNGRFRIDQKLMYLDEETAFMSSFMEIYTPISYPKK